MEWDKGKSGPSQTQGKANEILTRAKKKRVLVDRNEPIEVMPVHQDQLDRMKQDEIAEQLRQDELYERWLHSPERTKKWRQKLAKMEQAEVAKNKGPLADVWVQCEKPDCLKWRRLAPQHADQVDNDSSWFCYMNPDPSHRSCSSPQEDFLQVQRMANRLGIKYVSTSLPEGTLTWAKMPGFVKWPALVTTDYNYGVHVWRDADDEPLSYHLEYLGQVHTRGWMGAAQVARYGSVDEDRQLERAATPVHPALKRKNGRGRQKSFMDKSGKTCFTKNGVKCTVQQAVAEADCLVNMSITHRLKSIVFGRDSFEPTVADSGEDEMRSMPAKPDGAKTAPEVFKTPPRTKAKTAKKADAKIREIWRPDERAATAPASPQPSVSGVEAVRRQITGEKAMVNCNNKEEKFAIDVQMYKKNEKAFDQDLKRFLIRNGRPIVRNPQWKGIPITLFQLFLCVYERGGYDQVVKKRMFQQVYRELTGVIATTGGTAVRKYYERYMLPYELFINNKNYRHCFDQPEKHVVPKLSKPGQMADLPRQQLKTNKMQRRQPKSTNTLPTSVCEAPESTGSTSDKQEDGTVSEEVVSVDESRQFKECPIMRDPLADTPSQEVLVKSTESTESTTDYDEVDKEELRAIDRMLNQLDSYSAAAGIYDCPKYHTVEGAQIVPEMEEHNYIEL